MGEETKETHTLQSGTSVIVAQSIKASGYKVKPLGCGRIPLEEDTIRRFALKIALLLSDRLLHNVLTIIF
jgi:hypothetical protein